MKCVSALLCLLVHPAAAGKCLVTKGSIELHTRTGQSNTTWPAGSNFSGQSWEHDADTIADKTVDCPIGRKCKKAAKKSEDVRKIVTSNNNTATQIDEAFNGKIEFQQQCTAAAEDECSFFDFPNGGGCCTFNSVRIICGDSFSSSPVMSDFANCSSPCVSKTPTERKTEEEELYKKDKCFNVGVLSALPKFKKCYENIAWAKKTGIKDKTGDESTFYKKYEALGLTENSSDSDFQCVLWQKTKNNVSGDGHDCVEPCAANAKLGCAGQQQAAAPAPAPLAVPAVPVVKSGGLPTFAWVLIILGVCCGLPCLGLCCSMFICYEAVAFIVEPILGEKKAPQKKKRAVKKEAEPLAPATAMPMPVVTTSAPMPMYQVAPPTVTYAAPQVTYAAPQVTYAAPQVSQFVHTEPVYNPASVSYAAPMAAYAAPGASVSYAAPAATYAAPGGSVAYAAQGATYAAPAAFPAYGAQ